MNPTFYLLLAFFTAAVLTANAVDVLDMEGNIIIRGGNYYVLPANSSLGGGLTLRSTNPLKECPPDIVLESSPRKKGIAIGFYPGSWKSDEVHIAESENHSIGMDIGNPPCFYQPFWSISALDLSRNKYYVYALATPFDTDYGPQNDLAFKVMKVEGSSYYKFVHCPEGGKLGTPKCSNVGIYVKNNRKYLALTDEPLVVYFKKAHKRKRKGD